MGSIFLTVGFGDFFLFASGMGAEFRQVYLCREMLKQLRGGGDIEVSKGQPLDWRNGNHHALIDLPDFIG